MFFYETYCNNSDLQGHRRQDREENEAQRRQRLTVFRPESAPTLPSLVTASSGGPLDMSPEASLSGPPSAHDMSTDGIGKSISFLTFHQNQYSRWIFGTFCNGKIN